MASIITRPESLNDLSDRITEFKATKLNIDHQVDAFKHQVGLVGNTRRNLPFHPKALEAELEDLKGHLDQLQTTYEQLLTKEKFVQYLLQEPPLEITDLHSTEQEEQFAQVELNGRIQLVKKLLQDIRFKAESIQESRSSAFEVANDTIHVLDEINVMQEQIDRLNQLLGHSSGLTIAEATLLVEKNRQQITDIQAQIDQKQDIITEEQWKVDDLVEEVKQLKSKADALESKAAYALRQNRQGDPRIDKEYEEYQMHIDMCNHLFGIQKIEFASSSSLDIVYQPPIHNTLHIELDTTKDKVVYASITHAFVRIDDLVKMAGQLNANDGIRLITMETLARLKRV
ncbi:uncharacterized protein B0P05DRAFT_585205 [Gilbertella persicaria]|uniref:uncharacterized protein n=1 Tax=Gilbertella persicaria TaxID=101096 RepID=UPI00221F5E41|nr:uncharacterized protein B0P05DRAFT_585205 [Gilbertella persicaria]KAI8086982.1 hypothetical protein B0P05DRAFT_585205 [Gilbertella persicaria]